MGWWITRVLILDTTVLTSFRRQGIGQELVRKAKKVAQSKGVEWLHVDYEPKYYEFYKNVAFVILKPV